MRQARWLTVGVGVLLGLAFLASPVQAWGFFKRRIVACSPVPVVVGAPCQPAVLAPVGVTTTRVGLFGLRVRASIAVGGSVSLPPVIAPAPVISGYPPIIVPSPPGFILPR